MGTEVDERIYDGHSTHTLSMGEYVLITHHSDYRGVLKYLSCVQRFRVTHAGEYNGDIVLIPVSTTGA